MQGVPLPTVTKEDLHLQKQPGMLRIAVKERQTTRAQGKESGQIITETVSMGLIQGIRDLRLNISPSGFAFKPKKWPEEKAAMDHI